ncbi:RNA-processing protein 8 [Seminavis robusta]|uniref:Ribosomal RNA-processing protein 8 n=1 Tax=Seminavis robusta TaxID=568900 RepID=A0A9N8DCS0_9STRA|nr:RNA-processing protein 8 [Seminavis robusta]|eukprot:Sro83_g044600.1 RNA-processing protein 8 (545) ;mRNA; r:125423-127057
MAMKQKKKRKEKKKEKECEKEKEISTLNDANGTGIAARDATRAETVKPSKQEKLKSEKSLSSPESENVNESHAQPEKDNAKVGKHPKKKRERQGSKPEEKEALIDSKDSKETKEKQKGPSDNISSKDKEEKKDKKRRKKSPSSTTTTAEQQSEKASEDAAEASTPPSKKKQKKKRKRQTDKAEEKENVDSSPKDASIGQDSEAGNNLTKDGSTGIEGNEVWSKSKRKRMRRLKAKQKKQAQTKVTESGQSHTMEKEREKATSSDNPKDSQSAKQKGTSALQEKYAAQLTGSRFRVLNEELYTTTSATAFERFKSQPELFDQYHEGFRHQVESWPSNPVDAMYHWITKEYPKNTSSKDQTTVVADFGCGDAELARRLIEVKSDKTSTCPFQVHSFDLVAKSDLVTACDMANVPLKDKSVDVAIFCLALMGTNATDFLIEAHRVLKVDGKVKIAEVRSRFETTHAPGKKSKQDTKTSNRKDNYYNNSNSDDDPLNLFVEQLDQLGFKCQKIDRSNKMFVLMELKKNGNKPDQKVNVQIKPCIYKRR